MSHQYHKIEINCAACGKRLVIHIEVSSCSHPNDMRIDDLDISVRAYNILKQSGHLTVREVLRLNKNDLKRLPGCGNRTANEILMAVNKYELDQLEKPLE